MSARRSSDYVTAREATALLGVKAATLYSYVSRGLVRVAGVSGGRRYALDDLLRLKARHDARAGHGPVAAGALRWGDAVLETRISDVADATPRYRGHDAVALARDDVSFERVAELLWTATLPAAACWPVARASSWAARLASLRDAIPDGLDRMRVGFAVLSATGCLDVSDARAVVRALACLAGPWNDDALARSAAAPTVAAALCASFGVDASPERVRAVDRALVLCADHELNPSTFAARVAASAGADRAASLLAALSTHAGARHGRASEALEAWLDRVEDVDDVAASVRDARGRGEALPCCGHALYPDGDPRATALFACVADLSTPRLTLLRAWLAEATQHGEAPNLDAGLVALRVGFGLPRGAAAVMFAVGRSAGWIAHADEQQGAGVVLRPRARYVGAPHARPT